VVSRGAQRRRASARRSSFEGGAMFELVLVKDMIRVQPSEFDKDRLQALAHEIDRKYSNKVLEDVGLCVCLYEFEAVGDAQVFPSHGCAFTEVTFRLLVFRPFVNEVLVGKLVGMNEGGLKISLDFFDNVNVPSYNLQNPSQFDHVRRQWLWMADEAADDSADFALHINDQVRFQVTNIKFTRTMRNPSGFTSTSSEMGRAGSTVATGEKGVLRRRSSSVDFTEEEDQTCAMEIIGTMNESGLGATEWWLEPEPEAEEEEEEEEEEAGGGEAST